MWRSASTILLSLWVLIGFAFAGGSVMNQQSLVAIRTAMEDRLCYNIYWRGKHYGMGRELTFRTKIEGDRFTVWVDNLELTSVYRVAGYFTGRIKNGKAAIIKDAGYNVELLNLDDEIIERKRSFEAESVIVDRLTVPTDCSPRYEPWTLKKKSMMETVVKTMKGTISRFVRRGLCKYPKKVTITIADFNIDYPWTFVLIESPRELYSVALHDFDDYDSDWYEQQGEYPLVERRIGPETEELLWKIRKHGVVFEITIPD